MVFEFRCDDHGLSSTDVERRSHTDQFHKW